MEISISGVHYIGVRETRIGKEDEVVERKYFTDPVARRASEEQNSPAR